MVRTERYERLVSRYTNGSNAGVGSVRAAVLERLEHTGRVGTVPFARFFMRQPVSIVCRYGYLVLADAAGAACAEPKLSIPD